MTMTWLDVLKVSSPFFGAIFTLWFKAWFEEKRLKSAKQKILIRLISNDSKYYVEAINYFRTVASEASSDAASITSKSIKVPDLLISTSNDLATLVPDYADLYANLANITQIVESDIKNINEMISGVTKNHTDNGLPNLASHSKLVETNYFDFIDAAAKVAELIYAEQNMFTEKKLVDRVCNYFANLWIKIKVYGMEFIWGKQRILFEEHKKISDATQRSHLLP